MTPTIEMFDKRGCFVMPEAEAIAALDSDTRKRFRAIEAAAKENDKAVAALKAARKRVTDGVTAVALADKELREIRPPMDAVQAARLAITAWNAGR